mmetsp:Transcript_23191/g.50203  ORF Transcript_23191/g.50203 Transcript_23191/m.50203 type:complete len:800 (-) Transcript_23191:1350-3749(-)|eukprot:CAMPEP_0172326834 /NCGR_PEP_ID=MMETSP1058-20130122/57727_1 /TAXON_ID=83371 /ORGANISM="Detonula confervacea, Strain CCMP 353" /LENGTH=799 /DNA_ID=CAMNT_0013043721 /DNA_START=259 /DNA_END=2658 /DNA_ORIENTATION=-
MPRRDNIKIAMPLNHRIPVDNISMRVCAYCRGDIAWGNDSEGIHCGCYSCVYCSGTCRARDWFLHSTRCVQIQSLTRDIRLRTADLRSHNPDVLILFERERPHLLLLSVSAQLRSVRKKIFNAREKVIKELIHEGCRRGYSAGEMSNQTVLAYDIAIKQRLDLLLLQNNTKQILNLYLLTGRLEETYDLCCYFTRKDHTEKKLNDHELNTIWKKQVPHENITRSYFKRKLGEGDTLFVHTDANHWAATCHIFLVKYLLHISMENLIQINKEFLDNQDCMELIGEFVGMKKEWIISKKNWYRDQAHEVAHLFHCAASYHYLETYPLEYFQQIQKFAEEYFPGVRSRAIDAAIKLGTKWIRDIQLGMDQEKVMSTSKWGEIIQRYEADHNLLYTVDIQPTLRWAIKRINFMASWDAIGINVDPSLCITEFVTDAVKACKGKHRESFFYEFFNFMDFGPYHRYNADRNEELSEFDKCQNENFSHVMKVCLGFEKKLAQCHFHKNKGGNQIQEILDQLPGGKIAYSSDPPPDDLDGGFKHFSMLGDHDSEIDDVSSWPSDVTKVVDTLFEEGLATNDNLDALFGRSGYVSYRIFQLQQQKEKQRQSSIESFITRTRIWKEGCIDYDTSLGLKIKYLTKIDRRQQFDDMRKMMPMANFINCLEPSLEQFTAKFGWNNLGIEYFFDCVSSGDAVVEEHWHIRIKSKRRRCEMDGFLTVEEACRHYFHSASLEEAIFDLVGVPRLIVLNGDLEKMQKAGWKCCKVKSVLGDKSVQLGSRVAHVYSIYCSIWEEQSKSSSDDGMDSD